MSKVNEIKRLIEEYDAEIIEVMINYPIKEFAEYVNHLREELIRKNQTLKDEFYKVAKYEAKYGNLE